MLINLSDVLMSEGRQMSVEAPLEMSRFTGGGSSFEIIEKTPVTFRFVNTEHGKAKAEGSVSLTFRTVCDRCLSQTRTTLDLTFERVVASPEDTAEDEDADDLSFMEGYQLDVETFVYNEIIGNWPAKILCREDCRGLCPVCGQNRNERDCGCDTFVPDPRMAVIQDIFNANKEV
ncbi:MAG: DUF177 domain-containing protein [bacterium]|nr:DUF177 domain-containing protein [bacterium]